MRSRVCISKKPQVMLTQDHTLRTTGPNSKHEPQSTSTSMCSLACSYNQQVLLTQLWVGPGDPETDRPRSSPKRRGKYVQREPREQGTQANVTSHPCYSYDSHARGREGEVAAQWQRERCPPGSDRRPGSDAH